MRGIHPGRFVSWSLGNGLANVRRCRSICNQKKPRHHGYFVVPNIRRNNETNGKLLPSPTDRFGRRKTRMYESFYGLSHTPFSRDIPTDKLYLSSVLDETLGRLEYAAERQLFAVITGAVSYTHLRAHETRHDLVCRL